MMIDQLTLADALRARDEGMRTAELRSDILWREAVKVAIERLAHGGSPFTADDVRAIVGTPPPGFSTNSMGALFHHAAEAGLIAPAGYQVARHVGARGRMVRTWVGA